MLTDAYSEPTGVNTRHTLEKAGITATYVRLGTYQKIYVPLFPPAPRPSLSEGMQDVRDGFSRKYPAAQKLQKPDIAYSSFIDELEQSGFVQRLYASDPKR